MRQRSDRLTLLRTAEKHLEVARRASLLPGAMQVANHEVAEAKRIMVQVERQIDEHQRSHASQAR